MARFPFRFRGLLMCAIVLTIAWPLHARVWFVNAGATATNDGSSWADAFSDLQTALTVTESGDEIWVAAGTYTPAAPGGDRTATFQLKAGVALYGGFTGSESSRDERDPVANVTTLSGDLNDDDADVTDLADLLDEPTRAENSYHVVIASRADETGILDGFTITAGHANGLGSFSNGGGMVNFRGRSTRTQPAGPASPTLVNCTFSRNSALANGGGLYSEGGNPTLTGCTFRGNAAGTGAGMQISGGGSGTLTNCAFSGNTARNSGGGLYSSFGSPTLTNCTFSRNAAGTQGGGGMVNEGSNPTLINCVFIGNVTTGIDRPAGGGMFNRQGSSPILINCTFIANVAEFGGGVFGVENASTMTNCTFSGNVATLGGGIFAWTNSRPTVTNCIFWGDRDDIFGGAVVNYSCVQGGWFGAGGIGIIDADPRFMREPDDGGDGWGVGGNDDFGDLRLRVGSPCIDSGDNSAVLDGVTTDADRNPRIVDDPTRTDTGNGVAPIVDIGAYEYQGDCNGNGSPDDEDIASRVSRDCNGNRVPDECEPPSLPNCGLCMQYLANNTDPGIGGEWTQPGFDDSIWNEGTFGVGYGAGGMVNTTVATGTRSVYTRATFQIGGDPLAVVENVFLGLDYDDGVVAWINGVEVFRADMPVGMPQWNTPANSHESSNSSTCAAQRPQVDVDITDAARPLLVSGTNILAIGVWNRSSDSSDLALIPRLEFNRPPITVMRGPYLQMGTDTSIVVRWRTSGPTTGQVRYGTDPDSLIFAVDDAMETTEHEIMLSGLTPDTTYYYTVGTTTEPLTDAGRDYSFTTAPRPGTVRPTRLWVLGDSGTANANAQAVRDAYYAFAGTEQTDLWLMLGDNAYPNGTDLQYQSAVFAMYPEMLRTSALWTTLGNHDAISADSPSQRGVYYDIFTLPTRGEAGGLASGTEAYYAFDYANVHFICLDSQDTDRSPEGAMMTWLEEDLAATSQDWIVAFWHHPPYSKGSHDSDSINDSAGRLVDMRRVALPILEEGGVDLVLSGHSHSYERSYLIDGHYGFSDTLTNDMIVDGGNGRIDGNGAYAKPSGIAPREGAVYAVAGSSGQVGGGSLNHPVMFVSLAVLGSMVLDFDDLRLDAIFLDSTGAERDRFTIVKGTCNAGGVRGKCDPADFDRDGDVDLADWLIFDAGFSGSAAPTPDLRTDLDGDGDTDLSDLLILQAAFTGSQ